MRPAFSISLTLVLGLVLTVGTSAMKRECHPCAVNADCKSKHCFGNTCIIRGSRASYHRCLLAECEPCKTKHDCSTKFCFRRKCIFQTADSFEKCFINTEVEPPILPPPAGGLPECARCQNAGQCAQDVCAGEPTVCHANNQESRRACFRPECAKCQTNGQCASRTCSAGRCVFKSPASFNRCAIGLKDECKRCKMAAECFDGFCSGNPKKCNKGTEGSIRRCFRREECADCSKSHECKQGNCKNGRCTDGTTDSLLRCGLRPSLSPTPSPSPEVRKPNCEPCKSFRECSARQCIRGKCGSAKRVIKCKKVECERCRVSSDCEGNRLICFRSKCTTNRLDSLTKCGFKPICAACDSDNDCSGGLCTAGLCVEGPVDGYDGLLQCGRRRECDKCSSSEQCATRRCFGGRCTFLIGTTRKRSC